MGVPKFELQLGGSNFFYHLLSLLLQADPYLDHAEPLDSR